MHSCASVVMATIFTDCLLTVSQEKVLLSGLTRSLKCLYCKPFQYKYEQLINTTKTKWKNIIANMYENISRNCS